MLRSHSNLRQRKLAAALDTGSHYKALKTPHPPGLKPLLCMQQLPQLAYDMPRYSTASDWLPKLGAALHPTASTAAVGCTIRSNSTP
jgi:hypothetical protein